jgi:two-component system chemotaxis response regulator CheB/chemosensory pili system protein ChpB (putative protein-glutamate methylesterase)
MTERSAQAAALAMLNHGGELGAELRAALEALGARFVFEAPAAAFDTAALAASGARVVLINLGADDEGDTIEHVHALLDASDYAIVINDAEASAQLAAADRPRWARHLAAKILQRPEMSLPPAPPDLEPLPTFEQHWAARVPVAESLDAKPLAPPPEAPAHVEAASPGAGHADDFNDRDLMRALENFDAASIEAPPPDNNLHDFDALIAAAAAVSDSAASARVAAPADSAVSQSTAAASSSAATASIAAPEWSLDPLTEGEAPAAAPGADAAVKPANVADFSSALELVPLPDEAPHIVRNGVLYDTGRDLQSPAPAPSRDESKPAADT